MKLVSPLLLSLVAVSANASIDFTPTLGKRVLDGITFQQLIFHQDGHKITYEQPSGWKFAADSQRILFTPANTTQAQAEIEQSPLEAPQKFDEATVKRIQEEVLVAIPSNCLNVALVSAEKNPLMVNRLETFEIVVSYQISGVEFERSILFLNLPDTQLRFRVTARKLDFEKIHKAFRGSIYSWQWQ
jgi:hypothetical protein